MGCLRSNGLTSNERMFLKYGSLRIVAQKINEIGKLN